MNWGIPDWRDGGAYESGLSMTRWRWEFLRRREDYRADWLLHFEPSFRRKVEAYRRSPVPTGVASWEEHFSAFAEMPGCREKYGTEFLLDPSLRAPVPGLFVISEPYGVSYASEEAFDRYEADGHMLVAFDLRRPLPEQLLKAKYLLELAQAERYGPKGARARAHAAKWAIYLRVIDARAAGETFKAIGAELFGCQNWNDAAAKAHNTWCAANNFKV